MAAAHSASFSYTFEEVKKFDESKIGVKGLSDSGIKTIPHFFVHPPETLSNPKNSSSKHREIPKIDLSNLKSNDQRTKIVNQIAEAAKTWGFFQVINHGIPISALDSIIHAIRAFHEQPYEVKAKYYKREEAHGVMFSSNNDLYRAKAASWHDSLQAWMGPNPLDVTELPDICRDEMVAWDLCATKVSDSLKQ